MSQRCFSPIKTVQLDLRDRTTNWLSEKKKLTYGVDVAVLCIGYGREWVVTGIPASCRLSPRLAQTQQTANG
jgi:hypothetical protein